MIRSFAAIAAATLALITAGPAFAHWEWSRWGMSAQEVISASAGKLSPDVGNDRQRVNEQWRHASGPVTFDGFDFHAEFYFDQGGEDLRIVRLTLKDFNDCARLEARLNKTLGKPQDASETFNLPNGPVTINAYYWPKDRKGDFAALTSLPAANGKPGLCFVRYSPKSLATP
jgi:hypothetical protein